MRVLRLGAALSVVAGLATVSATSAAVHIAVPAGVQATAVVPLPSDDAFYRVPSDVADVPDGTVLASRAITAYGGPVPLPVHAWEVKYKTLDNQGRPTATVTTVLIPTIPWTGTGPRPMVSYQTAEDGVGAKCSPSYALHAGLGAGSQAGTSNSEAETGLMALLLAHGWAVAAPDYEGPDSDFLGADMEAHGVLDGVRAALHFAPDGLGSRTPVALWGYSGGSLATAVAAQLQAQYAPELKFAAIAIGGEVADLQATLNAFDGGAVGGGVVVGVIGVARSYPAAHLQRDLTAAGQHVLSLNQTDCLADAVSRYPFFNAADYEAVPNALDLPSVVALMRSISPLYRAGTPAEPVYDYHAVDDELAPIGPDRQLVAKWCAAGVRVDHQEDAVGEHITETVTGAPGAITYLAARFDGLPAPTTCAAT